MNSRRNFLKGAGVLAGAAGADALLAFSPLTQAEARLTPELVQLRPEMEPLVRLIERTPREKCVDLLVAQLRRGVSYRQLLAALYLAGVRNVSPQPPGFALHCVFVLHSAHQLGLDAPAADRLLPLFYALDYFKRAQDQDARRPAGDYVMPPLTGALPSPDRAAEELRLAMESWDKDRAERAVVSLIRHRGAHEVIEPLWRYGARDYRNIGHKAIYPASAWRTLQTIGWQHAEPVLRSVVASLVDFGKEERVNGYQFEDQSYLPNAGRARETIRRLKGDWTGPRGDTAVAREMLDAIRTATPDRASAEAASLLVKGRAQAGAIWDAVHLAAGELILRKPGSIAAIHAVTSANALRYAFQASGDPENRLLLLLQAVGWMGQFQAYTPQREKEMRDLKITDLASAGPPEGDAPTPEKALADLPAKVDAAAEKAFHLGRQPAAAEAFMSAATRLVFAKSDEPHYYKYAAAVFEDFGLVSPEWRPHLLSLAVYYLKGSSQPDTPVIQRARQALGKV